MILYFYCRNDLGYDGVSVTRLKADQRKVESDAYHVSRYDGCDTSVYSIDLMSDDISKDETIEIFKNIILGYGTINDLKVKPVYVTGYTVHKEGYNVKSTNDSQ